MKSTKLEDQLDREETSELAKIGLERMIKMSTNPHLYEEQIDFHNMMGKALSRSDYCVLTLIPMRCLLELRNFCLVHDIEHEFGKIVRYIIRNYFMDKMPEEFKVISDHIVEELCLSKSKSDFYKRLRNQKEKNGNNGT